MIQWYAFLQNLSGHWTPHRFMHVRDTEDKRKHCICVPFSICRDNRMRKHISCSTGFMSYRKIQHAFQYTKIMLHKRTFEGYAVQTYWFILALWLLLGATSTAQNPAQVDLLHVLWNAVFQPWHRHAISQHFHVFSCSSRQRPVSLAPTNTVDWPSQLWLPFQRHQARHET